MTLGKTYFFFSFFVVFIFLFVISFSRVPTIFAYSQTQCRTTGQIDYTGPDGPDLSPGYQCGDAKGYVYSAENGNLIHFNSGAYCCETGTPKPTLPPHKGYSLGASGGANCGNDSICHSDHNLNNPPPGTACGDDPKISANWHYGTDGNKPPQTPSCGAGFCCDAGAGGDAPTPPPPNPCPTQKGICTTIDTAFGTIDVSGLSGFIKIIFGILLSFAGGIAMLLIIISGYRIMTAQGDQEKLKGAKEMLTSAIIGLLFMIFSVTILQILGVDILHIPGFGK